MLVGDENLRDRNLLGRCCIKYKQGFAMLVDDENPSDARWSSSSSSSSGWTWKPIKIYCQTNILREGKVELLRLYQKQVTISQWEGGVLGLRSNLKIAAVSNTSNDVRVLKTNGGIGLRSLLYQRRGRRRSRTWHGTWRKNCDYQSKMVPDSEPFFFFFHSGNFKEL